MNSAFPNKTTNIEVKRTRSGRAVIPPLAGWTGERIVSSLDDAAPLQYVSPTLDARAQYLLSSSMLERFKKQKVIQEPYQMEGQNFHIAPASGCSGRTVPQQKQKNLRTGCRKPVTHRNKKDGRSKSQSKLVCVELPETPQKKRMKMTFHYQTSDKLDCSDIRHGIPKTLRHLVHNDSDSSGDHGRKDTFEKGHTTGEQCISTVNQDSKQKKNDIYHDSSHRPAYRKTQFSKTPDMVNKNVLVDQNQDLIHPSNASSPCKVVRQPSRSSYEADDENSHNSGKGMHCEDSAEHSMKLKVSKNWEQKNERVENSSQYDVMSELSVCLQTANDNEGNFDRRQEETPRGNKAADKHEKPILNTRTIEKNNGCLSDDIFEERNKLACHTPKRKQNKNITDNTQKRKQNKNTTNDTQKRKQNKNTADDIQKKKQNKHATDLSLETSSLINQKHDKMKAKKFSRCSEPHSDDIKPSEDSSLEVQRYRKNVSVSQTLGNDMFPKTAAKMSVMAKNNKPGRLEGTVELDQQDFHSDDSCSLHEVEGNVGTQKSPWKTGISFKSKSVCCNSTLSKAHMRDLKEKHGLRIRNVMHLALKNVNISKGERAIYYALDHSLPSDITASNEVRKAQNIQEGITVSIAKNVTQKNSQQKFCENDALETSYLSNVSGPMSKANKHSQPYALKSNPVPSAKTKLKSVSKASRRPSDDVHNNLSHHCEEVIMHKKGSRNDLAKTLLTVFPDDDNKLSQYNSYALSDDKIDQSRKDHPKNKSPICESHVVNEIPTKNLCKQFNNICTHEDESGDTDSKSSDQSMCDIAKEPSHPADGNQNGHVLSQKNGSHKSSVKSSPRDVDMPSNHELRSPDKDLCRSDSREQNCRLSPSRPVNKFVSSKENVVRRQSHIPEHRPKPSLSRKSLFNPMTSQLLVSYIASSSDDSYRSKQTNDKKFAHQKRNSSSPDENHLRNEQHPTKNPNCLAKNSKKHKLEFFGRQKVSLGSDSVEAAVRTEANVFAEPSVPLASNSCSAFLQSDIDAIRGSACNTAMGGNTFHGTQQLNNTFILPCQEDKENFDNQIDENQILCKSLLRHHQLDCSANNDSSCVENSERNNPKVSSSVCGNVYPRNSDNLETVDSISERIVKEYDFKYHYRQKPGNSRNDHDSSSVPYEVSCKSDCNRGFSHISNFDNSHPQKKRELSKSINFRCSSVESDFPNASTPIATKLPIRALETNSPSCHCKTRHKKYKDLRQNSLPESDLISNSDVHSGFVKAFCYNHTSNDGAPEHFAANIPTFRSSTDRTLFSHGANKNAICNNLKSENNRKNILDDSCALMRKDLESEVHKNMPSGFLSALSPIKSTSSYTVKERCVPKQNMYMDGEGSVVATHKNTSAMQANKNGLVMVQDCSNCREQDTGKIKNSQSVPSDSCFNSTDLESSSSDSSVPFFSNGDGGCKLNQKKSLSSCSLQGSGLRQNQIVGSEGKNHQDVIGKDGKNRTLLDINRELRSDSDAALNTGSSSTSGHNHSKKKFSPQQRTSHQASTGTVCEQKTSDLQKSPAAVMKLETREPARTGTQKKKKAVYRMHTRHNDDDESYDRMFDADGVVLQFERYAEAESDSSGSVESRRVSASAFKFIPVYDRKARHSKKQNPDKNNPRSYEVDTYLLDPEHTSPKKQPEQQNVFKDSGTIPRKDHTRRSGKSNVDNVLVIKELQKGEISDFRISKEDVENYYFTDEDSDTVYTNY